MANQNFRQSLTRYAWLSIGAAVVTIGLKSGAYLLTGSIGLLSDALESVVNLVAAIVALGVLTIVARPPDDEHAYGHDKADQTRKAAAEGIEALKEVSGSVDEVLANLIGGVQSGMGYLGAATLPELRAKARYIHVSAAGQKEAAPHDVVEVTTRKG